MALPRELWATVGDPLKSVREDAILIRGADANSNSQTNPLRTALGPSRTALRVVGDDTLLDHFSSLYFALISDLHHSRSAALDAPIPPSIYRAGDRFCALLRREDVIRRKVIK